MHGILRTWTSLALIFLLLAPDAGAWGRKGDKFYKDARLAENKKDWEKALDLYEQAILDDPFHLA